VAVCQLCGVRRAGSDHLGVIDTNSDVVETIWAKLAVRSIGASPNVFDRRANGCMQPTDRKRDCHVASSHDGAARVCWADSREAVPWGLGAGQRAHDLAANIKGCPQPNAIAPPAMGFNSHH
jgi:hypothetical protein